MGTSREITEAQLQDAKAALQVRVAAMQQAGQEKANFDRDPVWRKLQSRVRQIQTRLRAITEVEVVSAELAQRKIDNDARKAAEAAERKSGVKKAKPEKAKSGVKEKVKAKGEEKPVKKEKTSKPKGEKGEKKA